MSFEYKYYILDKEKSRVYGVIMEESLGDGIGYQELYLYDGEMKLPSNWYWSTRYSHRKAFDQPGRYEFTTYEPEALEFLQNCRIVERLLKETTNDNDESP